MPSDELSTQALELFAYMNSSRPVIVPRWERPTVEMGRGVLQELLTAGLVRKVPAYEVVAA